MKTYVQKPAQIVRNWYVVDATDVPLGRLAAQVAAVLRGKNKAEFTPYEDCGDFVIVINSDKVALTGKKSEQKFYRYHSGYAGGLKEIGYDRMLREKSDKAVEVAKEVAQAVVEAGVEAAKVGKEVAKAGLAGAKAGLDEAKKTYNENKNK